MPMAASPFRSRGDRVAFRVLGLRKLLSGHKAAKNTGIHLEESSSKRLVPRRRRR